MERTASEVRRVITLSSGHSRGSNLLAIHRYIQENALPIVLHSAVFTSSKAPAVAECLQRGIPTRVISARDMRCFETELLSLIKNQEISLIALCGFMKLLSADFIAACGIPILNIHPALLPKYGGVGMYGSRVHEAVFTAGEQRSGATVHLADPVYDHGRILAQKSVDITECKTHEEIGATVLQVEHFLYPRTIAALLDKHPLRVAINTLGCKTNFYESAAIFESFHQATLVDFGCPADVYVINTCSVTNRSDYKSRNLIRKALAAKDQNPLTKVIVTGCFAQRSRDEIMALGDVDYVVDNQSKLDIANLLSGTELPWQDIMLAEDFVYRPVTNMLSHTRAFQKIQDGCDFYCAYCAVPYGRGHSRSARFTEVVEQARLFTEAGFKEIVLGGVNLGLYRDGTKDLADVVKALSEIEALKMIRISSIEPQLLNGDLLGRLRGITKLCPHFHIPLQSGSDSILQRMGRRYDTALIRGLVSDILSSFPHAAIGFDVITGFPGESEELFEETRAFLLSLPIAYLHVFAYSRRRGTPADTMPGQVANMEKNRRSKILGTLSEAKKTQYRDLLLANDVELSGIVETNNEMLSDHYLRVKLPFVAAQGDYQVHKASELEFILQGN